MTGPSQAAQPDSLPQQTAARRPRRRPDFIYAGMPKAGSTWLYEALRTNSAVFVPDAKGIDFFDRNYDRGVDWYLDHFSAAGEARVVGDISHDTYACPLAAGRIHELFPDMRVIFCLREPGEAARSILQWWCNHTHAFGATVKDMVSHPHYRALLAYRESLERYCTLFDRSRMLVLFYEDLSRDPRDFLATVHGFLGLDPVLMPDTLRQRVNVSRSPRNAAFSRVVYRSGSLFRGLGAGRLVERAKRSRALQRLLYSGNGAGALPREIEAAMAEARQSVRPDLARIAELAGRELPSEWSVSRRP